MGWDNSYGYDANGNQTSRIINGQSYTLGYDAEGHMVSVSGPSLNVEFVYDGDGKRVKSTINGETTYFVGNYYEKAGTTITKYYYAGSSRVAMKVGSTVYYLLADHLGSTSLTTDASGNVVSEMRYTAWGEVRYASGSTPTKSQYTGQYSDSYINLLDYGSRRYDPETGRFISADTIVPLTSQGAQAWDRYAYVNNDPVKYTDNSGNCILDGCVVEAVLFTTATVVIISKAVEIIMFGSAPDTHGLRNAEKYVLNQGDATSTYTASGIAIQSNYEPWTDVFYRDSYRSGFGKAQVSRYDLSNKFGMEGADPFDPSVAVNAMQKRIGFVTERCNTRCSQTDIFIASALAQNGGFTEANMRDLVNGTYGRPDTSDPTKASLPWETFLGAGDNSYNRLMLRMFKNDVLALGQRGWTVPDIDWDFIDRLSKGGWRSRW